MRFEHLDKVKVPDSATVADAMRNINDRIELTHGRGFAVIVAEDGACVGVISDGDVRRHLLDQGSPSDPVIHAMQSDFIWLKTDYSPTEALRIFDQKIAIIPVLDSNRNLADLLTLESFNSVLKSAQQIVRSRVPARVSFSGGGTDFSGYFSYNPTAVLTSTINKYCTASILLRDDDEIHISSDRIPTTYAAESIEKIEFGDALDLVKSAIKLMQPKFGFNLEIKADFDPGTGLGGSSAVVNAVVGALNALRNDKPLTTYEIAEVSYQTERLKAGIVGGWQDQYATCFGGFNWIEFAKDNIVVQPIRLHREVLLELRLNLLLFRFGGNRQSGEIHKRNGVPSKDSNHNFEHLKAMSVHANEMRINLLKGELKKFGDGLDEGWQLKKRINKSASTPALDDLYSKVRAEGALGGKLLGAGLSGFFLVYSSPRYQSAIIDLLAEHGAKQEIFDFTNAGLETWFARR